MFFRYRFILNFHLSFSNLSNLVCKFERLKADCGSETRKMSVKKKKRQTLIPSEYGVQIWRLYRDYFRLYRNLSLCCLKKYVRFLSP